MAFVAELEFGGRNVVAAPPDLDLVLSVLLRGLGLVQSLQGAVVAFVQPPGLDHRQVVAVHLVGCVVEGLDRAGQH